jgi:cytochrome P450
MREGPPSWPEFPAQLITDRTSKEAQALWEDWLREARRVSWHGPMPALVDTEIIVRHEDARAILADEERFPQNFTGSFRAMALLNPNAGADFHALLDEMDASSLINQSGERHRALRALIGRAFTARRINRTRPFIRDLAGRLIADLAPGDDFVAGFSTRIPSTTLCELVGIPDELRDRCAEWVAALAVLLSPLKLVTLDAAQAAEVVAAREALIGACTELIARRRSDPPRSGAGDADDDLVTELARHDGAAFDDRALALNLADLLFGGNDNTQRALGQMLLVLVDHPDVWEAVHADPASADAVVEEILRYRPASPGAFRRTACPVQRDGADWPQDQVLWASSYSANRDEAVFADGTSFDPHRPNARDHLSFGHGHHLCIGANLARAELQESLRVLTATLTDLRLAGDVVIANEGAAGPVHLPLAFDRRAAAPRGDGG